MAASLSEQENKEEREEEPEPNPGVPGEQSPSEEHQVRAPRALLSARKRKAGLVFPKGKVPWSPLNDLTVCHCVARGLGGVGDSAGQFPNCVSYITAEEATGEEEWKSVPKKQQLLDSDEEDTDDERGGQGRKDSVFSGDPGICLILFRT